MCIQELIQSNKSSFEELIQQKERKISELTEFGDSNLKNIEISNQQKCLELESTITCKVHSKVSA